MQGILELWLFNKMKLEKDLTNEKIRREVEKRPAFRCFSKKIVVGNLQISNQPCSNQYIQLVPEKQDLCKVK